MKTKTRTAQMTKANHEGCKVDLIKALTARNGLCMNIQDTCPISNIDPNGVFKARKGGTCTRRR